MIVATYERTNRRRRRSETPPPPKKKPPLLIVQMICQGKLAKLYRPTRLGHLSPSPSLSLFVFQFWPRET